MFIDLCIRNDLHYAHNTLLFLDSTFSIVMGDLYDHKYITAFATYKF